MSAHVEFAARLFERYGLEPERVDLDAAERLRIELGDAGLDEEQLEAKLVAATVNGESYFLRHGEQFEWLVTKWMPAALERCRRSGRSQLRVLSAACSTGEEPYSLAATLLPHRPQDIELEIVALDVSERALAVARRGVYGLWSLRGVAGHIPRWLRVEGSQVAVDDAILRAVRFARHNLLDKLDAFGRFDLILCRNVLIYFHAAAITQVWTNLAAVLADGGALLTAAADPPPPAELGLIARWSGDLFVYGNRVESEAEPPRASTPPPVARREHTPLGHRDAILRLVWLGELDIARRLLVQFTNEHPLDVAAHLLLALVAGELGEHALAAEHGRKAAYLAPEEPYPAFVVAAALERLGHREAASTRYRAVVDRLRSLAPTTALRYANGLLAGQLEDIVRGRG